MVLINYATKEIVAKIVYYGPALCGKTTNLQHIYTRLSPKKRGKMISLSTESDRTLFFDFLPMELGKIQGFKVRFQLYTVPGQVFYGATRRLVLKGADAVVFVADSQEAVLNMNVESIEDMKENLIENNLDPETIPLVIQYNKRDLNGIMGVAELEKRLNWRGVPCTEAVAIDGPGVMETFMEITRALIQDLKNKHSLMDTDAIKELPPEVFAPEKPAEPEVIETEDVAFEIEHGSGYRDETAGVDVAAGGMLGMVETISLADTTQAEEFFDDVRKGIPTDEAREKVLAADVVEEVIDLSEAAGAIEEAQIGAPIPLRVGERELTPEEIAYSAEALEAEMEPGSAEPDITLLEADPYFEPVAEPVRTKKPAPETKPKAKTPAKDEPKKQKTPPVKMHPGPEESATATRPKPVPKEAAIETEKRFDNIQETLALLAKDVSMLGNRLDKQAARQPEPAPVAAPPEPDKRIDVVLQTLTELAREISKLGDKLDARPPEAPVTVEGPDLTPAFTDIKDALGRIEQEVSAMRLALTMMRESTANALQEASSSSGPELMAAFEELRKELRDNSDGQDRLLLSILESARESKQINIDAHDRLEDALRYLVGNVKGDISKKKWI